MSWSKLESFTDRYTWVPPEADRRMLLLDVGDGSLIEIGGRGVCRYPAAHVGEGALIVNTAGQGWVRQYVELDGMGATEAWELMEQVSDSTNPFWDHPDVVKSGYEEHRGDSAAVLAEIRDTEDPNRARDDWTTGAADDDG